MSKSLQVALPPMAVERVRSTSQPPTDSLRRWRELVTRALSKAELTRKSAASEMGISEQQLSDQLNGRENYHLSFWRMFHLPRSFWVELVDLICEFHDIPARGATAQDLEYMRIGKAYVELQQQVARQVQR